MSDPLFDLRDEVVTQLNSAPPGTFTPTFTAEAADAPIHGLEELADVKVSVVGASDDETISSRSTLLEDIVIDVGVQQQVPGQNDPLFATLRAFVKAIGRYFLRMRLNGFVCYLATNKPPYYPDHLKNHSVFTSIVSLHFKAEVTG